MARRWFGPVSRGSNAVECGNCRVPTEFVEFGGAAYCLRCGYARGSSPAQLDLVSPKGRDAEPSSRPNVGKPNPRPVVAEPHVGDWIPWLIRRLLALAVLAGVIWTWDTDVSLKIRRLLMLPFELAFEFAFWAGVVAVGAAVGVHVYNTLSGTKPPRPQ
jgi:hypothetical protein